MQQIVNIYTLIFGESKMLSDACSFEELEVPFGDLKPADRGPPAGRVSTEERTTKLILQLHKSIYKHQQYILINIHTQMYVHMYACVYTLIHMCVSTHVFT